MNLSISKYLFLCLFFVLLPALAPAQTSSPYVFSRTLDINSSDYSRYRLKIENDLTNPIETQLVTEINQYLLYSGVFNTQSGTDFPEYILKLEQSKFFGVFAALYTPNNVVLLEDRIQTSLSDKGREKKITDFIDRLILKIDGQSSLFNSAILYSSKITDHIRNIVLTDYLGNRRVTIVKNGKFNTLPCWSPNGKKICYTSIGITGTSVYVLDLESFVSRELSPAFGSTTGGSFVSNDQLIATQTVNGRPSLFLFDLSKNTSKRILGSPYVSTNGRPLGNRLLFASDRSRGVQVFLKTDFLKDGPETRITFFGTNNSEPNWNNQGNVILYSSYFDFISQIFLVSLDGLSLRQLTFDPDGAEQGVWSPDNRQVLYATSLKESQRLVFVTLDGGYKRYLTVGPKNAEANPAWINDFNWSDLD